MLCLQHAMSSIVLRYMNCHECRIHHEVAVSCSMQNLVDPLYQALWMECLNSSIQSMAAACYLHDRCVDLTDYHSLPTQPVLQQQAIYMQDAQAKAEPSSRETELRRRPDDARADRPRTREQDERRHRRDEDERRARDEDRRRPKDEPMPLAPEPTLQVHLQSMHFNAFCCGCTVQQARRM